MEEVNRVVVSPKYDRAVLQSLGVQFIVGCFAMLLLDGGVMARVVGVAMLGFWISVGVLMTRRPFQPTQLDLTVIRWGFLPVLLVTALVQFIS